MIAYNAPTCPRSSVDESVCLRSRRSQVRTLSRAPSKIPACEADSLPHLPFGKKIVAGSAPSTKTQGRRRSETPSGRGRSPPAFSTRDLFPASSWAERAGRATPWATRSQASSTLPSGKNHQIVTNLEMTMSDLLIDVYHTPRSGACHFWSFAQAASKTAPNASPLSQSGDFFQIAPRTSRLPAAHQVLNLGFHQFYGLVVHLLDPISPRKGVADDGESFRRCRPLPWRVDVQSVQEGVDGGVKRLVAGLVPLALFDGRAAASMATHIEPPSRTSSTAWLSWAGRFLAQMSIRFAMRSKSRPESCSQRPLARMTSSTSGRT